jgi:hypothetical protein
MKHFISPYELALAVPVTCNSWHNGLSDAIEGISWRAIGTTLETWCRKEVCSVIRFLRAKPFSHRNSPPPETKWMVLSSEMVGHPRRSHRSVQHKMDGSKCRTSGTSDFGKATSYLRLAKFIILRTCKQLFLNVFKCNSSDLYRDGIFKFVPCEPQVRWQCLVVQFLFHEPYLLNIPHINGTPSFGILKVTTSCMSVSIACSNLRLKSAYSKLGTPGNLKIVRVPQTSYLFKEISLYIMQ